MLETESKQTQPQSESPIETIRFVFPRNHELALYALATLQSYADHYDGTVERINLWNQIPALKTQLRILVQCDQRFYMTFRDSFPACTEYVVPYLDAFKECDEMCVELTEERLERFDPSKSYSVQWVMAILAGTKPKVLPTIVSPHAMATDYAVVYGHFGIQMQGSVRYVDEAVVAARSNKLDFLLKVASELSIVIAPQGFFTVLAAALGKPVLEVTKSNTIRALVGMQNYVQVSYLTPQNFFIGTIERGVAWLKTKMSLQSVAATAVELSAQPATVSVLRP